MIFKNYFFLLPSNSWPIFRSVSAFNFILSLVYFFKYSIQITLVLRILNVGLSILIWWSYFRIEIEFKNPFSFNLIECLKFSFLLFILSEVIFFFSFFWGYFHFFLSPSLESGLFIRRETIVLARIEIVPLAATITLILSGVTVTLSHHFLNELDTQRSKLYLIFTFVLGLSFTLFQVIEYTNLFFSIRDGFIGSIFFLLTGFHGIHVIVGRVYLFLVFLNFDVINMNKINFMIFDFSCWYWHFVDVIWLVVFFRFYYLNN